MLLELQQQIRKHRDRLPGGPDHRVCSRCVMDTTDPQIVFDKAGVCSLCTEFLEVRLGSTYRGGAGPEYLERLLEDVRIAGRGRDHDCVIGMSGGLDSSYLALIVCKEYGLRPLAVHMDNGWDTADSVRNIKSVVDMLKLDYECTVLDWGEFRRIQLAFLRSSVPEAETPTDVAIPEVLHAAAERYGIKYILGGGNLATEGILPKAWHYNARDRRYFNTICAGCDGFNPQKFVFYDYRRELYYKFARGIRTIYPLNHLRFTKAEAIELLKRDLDFRYYGQKHHESLYSRFIQSYYLYVKFGIDYRRATYSSMILDGQLDRDDALKDLAALPYDAVRLAEDLRYVAAKLELPTDELEDIISQRPQWYWEFPNDEKKLALIYAAYRRLYGKRKLASV